MTPGQTEFEFAALARLPAAELGYIAGLIDGDGCISFSTRPPGRGAHWRIQVDSVNPELVRWLAARLVGHTQKKKPPTARQRPVYRWELSGERAAALCVAIEPLLVIKGEQARLFAQSYRLLRGGREGSRGLDPTILAERARISARFRELNRRGAVA
jgi:hypothetical protein